MRRMAMLLLALGCGPDFENPTTVKDLRILAVVADPPEVVVDVGDLATVETIPDAATLRTMLLELATKLPDDALPPITVRPVVVDPSGGGRPIRYRIVACGNEPPTMGRERDRGAGGVRDTINREGCSAGAPEVASGEVVPTGADIVPPIEVTFTPTRELLGRALTGDPLGVIFGLPVTLELTVTAGEETAIGHKRILFVPRLTPEQKANRNPTIPMVTFRKEQEDPAAPIDLTAPRDAPPKVAAGETLLLTPHAEPLEPYVARAIDRQTQRIKTEQVEKETLRYAFFATAGTFSPGRVSTEPSPIRSTPTDGLTTEYKAPKIRPDGSGLVEVFLVVRDERGGASFVRLALQLE